MQRFSAAFSFILVAVVVLLVEGSPAVAKPNIVWIVAEDASPHIGCYGEKTIATPNLDRLAADGVRFQNAFVTCPVCSPARSALVTGMFQTTLGAHNHRSQTFSGKGGGNEPYYESYYLPEGIKTIPQLFREAGYHVTNGSFRGADKPIGPGKTDYNFETREAIYDMADWRQRPDGKPFFAQLQLSGGKGRNDRYGVSPEAVTLPAWYPDHPVLRKDWARYLNSWLQVDQQVGEIMGQLEAAGVLDDTAVFFITDHGISHVRGKQFLYEEGIRIPMIARLPEKALAGSARFDLVLHIDLAATSLALAGIPVPEFVQGRDLFAEGYEEREYIVAARDRCDETVDMMRCVRTARYKYIRNVMWWMPYTQPNQYKDGKEIVQVMRYLHREGKLTELQERPFSDERYREELYDLAADPDEAVNLAPTDEAAGVLEEMRAKLDAWIEETRDVGMIPEPILENYGKVAGSKYAFGQSPKGLEMIRLYRGGAPKDRDEPRSRVAPLYWEATRVGIMQDFGADLFAVLNSRDPSVRIAGDLALARLGQPERALQELPRLGYDENRLVGLYAIRALEAIGYPSRLVLPEIEDAQESDYEFTRRVARRLARRLGGSDGTSSTAKPETEGQ